MSAVRVLQVTSMVRALRVISWVVFKFLTMLCCAFVFQFYSHAHVFSLSIFQWESVVHSQRVPNHRHLHVYLLMAKKMATLGHPSTLLIPLVAKTCTMSRASLQSAGIMGKFNIWCVGKGTARLTTPGNL